MYLLFAAASLRDDLTPLAGDEKGFPSIINNSNTVQAEKSPPQIPR